MTTIHNNDFLSSSLQGEFGSGLHGVNGGAGTPPSSELQADGDSEESLAGAGEPRFASVHMNCDNKEENHHLAGRE